MSNGTAKVKELISKGHSAAWDQNWENAAGYYRQALEIDQDNLKALTSLGLALFEMREYNESLNYYLQAADLDLDDPLPYEKITLIHERMGNPEPAREFALRAAEAFIKNQDVDKAIENWNRAIGIDPYHVRAHARLAMVFQRLGKPNRAVTKYIHVASILQNNGQTKKAAEAVERALKISPESIKAVRAKEMIQQQAMIPLPERFQKAIPGQEEEQQTNGQLSEPEPTEEVQPSNPVEEAVERAITVMAKSVFEERVYKKPTDKEEQRSIDSFLMDVEKGEDEVRDDSLIKLHVSQAIENFSSEKWKDAAEELKMAVDEGYNHPAAYFLLGYSYFDLGRLESAERNLKKGVGSSEFNLASRLILGQIYREKELWEDASREYLEALRLADTSVADREKVDDLISLYEVMIEDLENQEGDESYREISNHVETMLLQPNWREVIREYRDKAEGGGGLLPAVDDLLADRKRQVIDGHQLIQEYTEEGHLGAAMEKAFFALRNAPSYLPLHITIGDLLLEQGQNEAAVSKYLAVANVYAVQGKPERTLSMLKKIIELEPMNIDVRQRYIDHLEEMGKREEAIVESNNLADVFYNLAELDRARDTYTRALELTENYLGEIDWQRNILLRLADIDVQRLDWEAALKTFKRISNLYPEDEETSINIVSMQFQSGNKKLAEDEIERYLSHLDPEEDSEMILLYLKSLRDENPRLKDIRMRLASFYESRGQKKKAIAELDSLGDMLLDEGRKDEVIELIEKIVAMDPPNVEEYKKLLGQLR